MWNPAVCPSTSLTPIEARLSPYSLGTVCLQGAQGGDERPSDADQDGYAVDFGLCLSSIQQSRRRGVSS